MYAADGHNRSPAGWIPRGTGHTGQLGDPGGTRMTHHWGRRVRVLQLRADRNNLFVRDIHVRTPITTDSTLDAAAKHPGLSDPHFLLRRRAIASPARGHRVGAPSPRVDYTDAEQRTWRTVHRRLWDAQREHACRAALHAREQVPVPADHIPQHTSLLQADQHPSFRSVVARSRVTEDHGRSLRVSRVLRLGTRRAVAVRTAAGRREGDAGAAERGTPRSPWRGRSWWPRVLSSRRRG